MNKPVARLFAVVLLAVKPLHAQSSNPHSAAADVLFNDAMKLIAAGKHEQACLKLDASFRLDPAIVSLFRLAECYEKTGKLDVALSHYLTVVRMATDRAELGRAEFARKRAEAIQTRMPKPEPRPPKTTTDVKAQTPSENQPEKPLQSTASIDKPASVKPTPASAPKRVRQPMLTPQRIGALVAGGAGLVWVVVGTAFGARAFSTWAKVDPVCDGSGYDRCDLPAAKPVWQDASTSAGVSTAGFVAGGISLAAAGVLWFLPTNTPKDSSRQPSIRVIPIASQQILGAAFVGSL